MKTLLIASFALTIVAADVCTPGEYFQKGCNWCKCASDGQSFACTNNVCPEVQLENKLVCKPKAIFKNYCNTCWCSNDGTRFSCTKMLCDENIWNEDGTLKDLKQRRVANSVSKKICLPNSNFKESCNTCICSNDGLTKFCTMMDCKDYVSRKTENWGPAYKQGDACTPGQVFYSECNRCICSKTGNNAFCTFKEC